MSALQLEFDLDCQPPVRVGAKHWPGAAGNRRVDSVVEQACRRSTRGAMANVAGQKAEDAVQKEYEGRGLPVSRRRYRNRHGEIDIIARDGDTVVFVEVKQRRTLDDAAQSVRPKQIRRLWNCALEFLCSCPRGINTPARFDVALVDRFGRIRVIENALVA